MSVELKSTNVRHTLPLPMKLTFAGLRAVEAASPDLAARLAGELWILPRRYQRPRRELALLDSGERLTIPLGLGSLRGWRWGRGPTILLVHGWEGRGAQLGAFVEPLVAAGFSVVTWDAPAHGETEGRKATLVTFADALAATVRKVGPVYGAVAHSMGGASTLYAIGAGISLGRLVFIAPADASQAIGRFTRFIGLGEGVKERMEQALEHRYGGRLEEYAGARLASEGAGPMLVIHDESDPIVPAQDGWSIADAWPGAHKMATEGLGHHRILRDQSVIDAVVGFMAEEDEVWRRAS